MRAFSIFALPDAISDADRLKRRHMLARLGLAWLAMMQVMMFAFPGYLRSGDMAQDGPAMLDQAIFLMNWISLAITIPVIGYCGWPVWSGALAPIRDSRMSMDVPVALGIIAAFIPSVYATWNGHGEVYFDSVTMFVAFLLTARYLELCARQSIGLGQSRRILLSQSHRHVEQHRAILSASSDRVAMWFMVIQLGVAFGVGLIWFSYAPQHAVAVMVALLVISCPCAMAMAVPTAMAAVQASLSARPYFREKELYQLMQAMGRVSRQNLYGSMVWHLLMMPVAALGWVAPWLAAVTMLLSSLAVAANSWRLFKNQTRMPACEKMAEEKMA